MVTNGDAVEEVAVVTSDVLLSVSRFVGRECVQQNLAFAKCKEEDGYMEHCLEQVREGGREGGWVGGRNQMRGNIREFWLSFGEGYLRAENRFGLTKSHKSGILSW